jgi:hypothetical protein
VLRLVALSDAVYALDSTGDLFRLDTPDVYGALWVGALMLASAMIKDPFPPELEEVAVTYFELFPPTAKA